MYNIRLLEIKTKNLFISHIKLTVLMEFVDNLKL